MEQTGTLLVRVFLSRAQLPISNAMVIVSLTENDGRQRLLATRLTDESGVAGPITLVAPAESGSLTPGNGSAPFYRYNLVVDHPGYQLAVFHDLQIFPGVETVQDVPMLPLADEGRTESDLTTVTPQPL